MLKFRRMKILWVTLFFILMSGVVRTNASALNREGFNVDEVIKHCVEKVKNTMNNLVEADSLPRNIYTGQTDWNKVGIHDWTSGFWPGLLWYSYEASGDKAIFKGAGKFTEPLEGVLDVPVANHDLGFMLYCSFGNGYRLTQNKNYHDILIRAADSLATLYNPRVGTILSWPGMVDKMGWPHNTIIDNMINLELLFWASKNGGDKHYYDMAVKHAKTCMNTLIRPDYSTYHVAVFDTTDGHFIKGVTHQGYADDSQWARGQAWGIYGYAMCYRETGMEEFLTTSQKLADVLLKRLPEDGIPYWDLDDPEIPNAPKDASAAAVAASGMLELSSLLKDQKLKTKYYNAAVKMLRILSGDKYLSKKQNQSILLHSTGHKPHNSEIDASIIYADYYFMEALLRLKKYDQASEIAKKN
jgi:unsaturated chondroitin disaccharide hydrolase